MKNKLRIAIPHLIAFAVFAIISFTYFYPVLEGKVLRANDSLVSRINSKEIQDHREKYGEEPLWTNSIFGGMPAYLISTRYPGNLFKKLDTLLRVFKMPVSVLFLAMAGFYILLLIFGINPWLAITGSIAYGLSAFLFQILAAGHNTQAIALVYMAPLIGSIYYAYRYNAVKGALLTALILTLEITANHPQITYYGFLCLLVFAIVELIYAFRSSTLAKFFKTSAILVIPFVIAIGINFASLYTVYQYGKYSIRGASELTANNENATSGLDKNYITSWSYGVGETFNLLVPDFRGGSSKPFDRDSETYKALKQNNAVEYANQILKYWGPQPGTDGPHYIGAVVIFLFLLGIVLVKGREKWWLVAATLLSVMLAWGKNFMPFTNFFIEYFPGYNKFRAVTMALVIAQFCIPLLGLIALRDIYNGSLLKKDIIKGFKISGGIALGLLILFITIPGIAGSFMNPHESVFPDWLRNAIIADRKELLINDSLRSLFFIVAAGITIISFLYDKLRKEYSILILALLIILDMWGIDKRYLNADRFERPSAIQKSLTPSAADAFILKDPSENRVLNMSVSTFNDNSPTSYFHHSIGGYHGAKLRRYQELIDSAVSRDIMSFEASVRNAKSIEELQNAFTGVFRTTNSLNMLNTRYAIVVPEAPPLINPYALGNAWFAENPIFVENAEKEISAINSFDPSSEAIVDVRFKDLIPGSRYPGMASDTIWLSSYKANELIYRYSTGNERLTVFSEIYYPEGWKSFIDGKEVAHFRTNYVLRGMIVPAGEHEIRFSFNPESYITGNKISLASSVLLILLILGYITAGIVKWSKTR